MTRSLAASAKVLKSIKPTPVIVAEGAPLIVTTVPARYMFMTNVGHGELCARQRKSDLSRGKTEEDEEDA